MDLFKLFWKKITQKDVNTQYAGNVPNSLLARQDLEGKRKKKYEKQDQNDTQAVAITDPFTTSSEDEIPNLIAIRERAENETQKAEHSDRWQKCVEYVKAIHPDVNAYAVCTALLGDESFKSIKKQLVKENRKSVKKQTDGIPPELKPLADEAKKYPTADIFANVASEKIKLIDWGWKSDDDLSGLLQSKKVFNAFVQNFGTGKDAFIDFYNVATKGTKDVVTLPPEEVVPKFRSYEELNDWYQRRKQELGPNYVYSDEWRYILSTYGGKLPSKVDKKFDVKKVPPSMYDCGICGKVDRKTLREAREGSLMPICEECDRRISERETKKEIVKKIDNFIKKIQRKVIEGIASEIAHDIFYNNNVFEFGVPSNWKEEARKKLNDIRIDRVIELWDMDKDEEEQIIDMVQDKLIELKELYDKSYKSKSK